MPAALPVRASAVSRLRAAIDAHAAAVNELRAYSVVVLAPDATSGETAAGRFRTLRREYLDRWTGPIADAQEDGALPAELEPRFDPGPAVRSHQRGPDPTRLHHQLLEAQAQLIASLVESTS